MSAGPLHGIVLAGGASRRMGTDKSLLLVPDGRTLLEHTVGVLRSVAATITVIGRESNTESRAGVRWLPDTEIGAGPLAGIASGLVDALAQEHEWSFVVAVDLPLLRPSLLVHLASMAERGQAVVPIVNGAPQPLLAMYHPSALFVAQRLLQSGERRARALPEHLRTRWIPGEELRAVDPDLQSFVSVNTPEEWERIQNRLPAGHEAR